jgi:hypothetical protein
LEFSFVSHRRDQGSDVATLLRGLRQTNCGLRFSGKRGVSIESGFDLPVRLTGALDQFTRRLIQMLLLLLEGVVGRSESIEAANRSGRSSPQLKQ